MGTVPLSSRRRMSLPTVSAGSWARGPTRLAKRATDCHIQITVRAKSDPGRRRPTARQRVRHEEITNLCQRRRIQPPAGQSDSDTVVPRFRVSQVDQSVVAEVWVKSDIHQTRKPLSMDLRRPWKGIGVEHSIADHSQAPPHVP